MTQKFSYHIITRVMMQFFLRNLNFASFGFICRICR